MSALDPLALLLPPPKRIERLGPGPRLDASTRIAAGPGTEAGGRAGASAPWRARLERLLAPATRAAAAPGDGPPPVRAIEVAREPGAAPAQGYRLELAPERVRLVAADDAGLLHGALTLLQLASRPAPLAATGTAPASLDLPGVVIHDAPDFALRGVQLDVSRCKVPTLETLFALVERLASFKLNHLQLYTEHAFAYRGHERVWRDASPYAPEELRALDRHCASLGVELAANQQSLGHLHRWLVHEPYRALAEVPEGVVHPFSLEREPYGLCPTDARALALLADLYDQLLPCFTSRTVNVGLDEPLDLGLGRSRAAAQARGAPALWLEHLRAVHGLCAERGRRAQVYGDFIASHPELVPALPDDLTVIAWGYEAGHDFARELEPLAAAGRERWVAPGTSSWQSFGGRPRNALQNLSEAARAGRAHGARGMLVCDWGDRGHHQPLAASWPGFAHGACAAWNADASEDEAACAARLDTHVFADSAGALGRALFALGDAHERSGARATNGGALFFVAAFADEDLPHARTPGLTRAGLERALGVLEDARGALADARPAAGDGALIVRELGWSRAALVFAARLADARLATSPATPTRALPTALARALRDELDELVRELQAVWLARNRAGGLAESRGRLERIGGWLAGGSTAAE